MSWSKSKWVHRLWSIASKTKTINWAQEIEFLLMEKNPAPPGMFHGKNFATYWVVSWIPSIAISSARRSAIPVGYLTLQIINESWPLKSRLYIPKMVTSKQTLPTNKIKMSHGIITSGPHPNPILVPIRTFWRSGVATGTTSSTFWSGAVGLLNSYKLSRF